MKYNTGSKTNIAIRQPLINMASFVFTLYTNSAIQNNHHSKCNITHFEKRRRQMHCTLHANKHTLHRTGGNPCMRVGGSGAVRELLNVESA